eukprot:5500748-Prymnesium_polylepis.1
MSAACPRRRCRHRAGSCSRRGAGSPDACCAIRPAVAAWARASGSRWRKPRRWRMRVASVARTQSRCTVSRERACASRHASVSAPATSSGRDRLHVCTDGGPHRSGEARVVPQILLVVGVVHKDVATPLLDPPGEHLNPCCAHAAIARVGPSVEVVVEAVGEPHGDRDAQRLEDGALEARELAEHHVDVLLDGSGEVLRQLLLPLLLHKGKPAVIGRVGAPGNAKQAVLARHKVGERATPEELGEATEFRGRQRRSTCERQLAVAVEGDRVDGGA